MAANFASIGTASIGAGFLSFCAPAKLEITEENLLLSCFWKKWGFPKTSIVRLSHTSNWFSEGIGIGHTIPDYSSSIVFLCFYYDRLKSELEKSGYVVS